MKSIVLQSGVSLGIWSRVHENYTISDYIRFPEFKFSEKFTFFCIEMTICEAHFDVKYVYLFAESETAWSFHQARVLFPWLTEPAWSIDMIVILSYY